MHVGSNAIPQTPDLNRSKPVTSQDDRNLREIFDSESFWREFSKPSFSKRLGPEVGLCQNRYLTTSEGFEAFAQSTLERCRKIVNKVLDASAVEEYRSIARDLDRLSDLLCRVIDLTDFVRSTHPDPKFQTAATNAYALMFEYMNVLNTTTGLKEQLQNAAQNPEVLSSWSEEERIVVQILMKDFSRSAIDLPQRERQSFVRLSNTVSHLGSKFLDEMEPAISELTFESSRLKGVPPNMLKEHTNAFGRIVVPTMSAISASALRYAEDDSVRKEIYLANHTASKSQIQVLEKLLYHRAKLANLSSYPSFSSMTLADKMAKSPQAVNRFLKALWTDNFPRVQEDLDLMRTLKALHRQAEIPIVDNPPPIMLKAWERDYYRHRLSHVLRRAPTPTRRPDFLPAFFSLGTVMQGLSRLFTRLYGVRFAPRGTDPGETWNHSVRRLDVIDESEGHIAVVYCDLFARPGKSPNPAHFTLRCSRLIPSHEISEVASSSNPLVSRLPPHQAANDGMATSLPDSSGSCYQLPTIALICDFTPPSNPLHPTLLSFREVQTLFHEMGHAVHSILGRTQLQNVSGTRCATDFAELPSVLMEYFAADQSVLKLFARHWETDAPLPYEMVEENLKAERAGAAAETGHQIVLAMLDQAYHSAAPLGLPEGNFDSTKVWHEVSMRYGCGAEPRGTNWQGFFGHLVGYGGVYYSYLFDRAIAGKVWEGVFGSGSKGKLVRGERGDGGAVSREAGEKFRSEVLKWGGGRDGWKCVAGVLGEADLEEGGEKAMEKVGKWGVGS